jgi:hypothetical protein
MENQPLTARQLLIGLLVVAAVAFTYALAIAFGTWAIDAVARLLQ